MISQENEKPGGPLAQLIIVRHGQTGYTNVFPDLTPEGIEQVKQTAFSLKNHLQNFDQIYSVSSPAVRALGTNHYLLESLGLNIQTRRLRSLRPFDIKDFEGFMEFDRKNSTPRYGEMFLTHPYLMSDNDLIESSFKVLERGRRALYHGTRFVAKVARQTEKNTLLLASTHFELAVVALAGLYPESDTFPIKDIEGPNHAETIIIKVDTKNPHKLLLNARGLTRSVLFVDDKFLKVD
jgi:broad specificity phosphatase PhoE